MFILGFLNRILEFYFQLHTDVGQVASNYIFGVFFDNVFMRDLRSAFSIKGFESLGLYLKSTHNFYIYLKSPYFSPHFSAHLSNNFEILTWKWKPDCMSALLLLNVGEKVRLSIYIYWLPRVLHDCLLNR